MRKLFLILVAIFGIAVSAMTQDKAIHGVVISGDDNEPVVGATIMVTGTNLGTTTDVDGKFRIKNVPANAKTIKVSYVGMTSQ